MYACLINILFILCLVLFLFQPIRTKNNVGKDVISLTTLTTNPIYLIIIMPILLNPNRSIHLYKSNLKPIIF